MRTFHLNDLPKEKRIQIIAEFYDVINSLENRDETRLFLKDLLTGDEIATLMRRIEVATLLKAGFNYEEVRRFLGVSNNKINKIQKILSSEEKGKGFDAVIDKLLNMRKERIKKQERGEKIRESLPAKIKRKHSYLFLLDNLIDDAFDSLKNDAGRKKDAVLLTPSFRAKIKK